MSSFVLRPCWIRGERIVLVKHGQPLTVDWQGLSTLLAPEGRREGLLTLSNIRAGCYVGRSIVPRQDILSTFLLKNITESNDIRWLLRKDKDFPERVKCVYLVESVCWDVPNVCIEIGGSEVANA